MEKWSRLKSDHNSSENDDTNDTEIIDNEPIDLKQVESKHNYNHVDVDNDWESLRLIKSKAFTIKDILGLDENEKLRSTQCNESYVTDLSKSSSVLSDPSMFSLFLLILFYPIETIKTFICQVASIVKDQIFNFTGNSLHIHI